MNSSYLQPANRAFGLEIGNNRHETSFLGRRRTLDQQPISKPLCNYDRESFPHGEHPCQSKKGSQMQIQEPTGLLDPTATYESDISRFLVRLDQNNPPVTDYFQMQTDISCQMRSILLNWLVDVHLKYKLLPQTLFIAVDILDRYLEKRPVQRGKLQLLGITSLWIAAKFEEVYQVPKISNLVFICNEAYSRADILEMEGNILLALNFELLEIHSLSYLQLFLRKAVLTQKDSFLAHYLCEICLLDFRMKRHSPRLIAAAAIFFIKKVRRQSPCWSSELVQVTEFNEGQIRQCAREICAILQNIQQNQHMEALRKKFSSSQFGQVGKIKIAEKPKQ